jgi:hypothetical protein
VSYTPSNLLYVLRAETEVINNFGRAWRRQNSDADVRKVRPAFVVDAENPKTRATAVAWAESRYWWRDPEPTKAEIIEHRNVVIPSVELITLDKRSEGGRAWKVLVDDIFYVDLREDTLLDVLLYGQDNGQGIIRGPFIWLSMGNGLKLMRYGGSEHEEVAKWEKTAEGIAATKKRLAGYKKQIEKMVKP